MNRKVRNIFYVFPLVCLASLPACGLTVSSEERVERAAAQIEAGQYRAAMIELKNALANEGDNAKARLLLAKVSLGLGDVLGAEKELARAATLKAAESDVQPLHMKILLAKREFTEVLAALGMKTGGLTEAQQLQFRGSALLGLGNFEAAKATYEEWLSADPGSTVAAAGLADAKVSLGDIEGGLALLQEAVQRSPDNAKAWFSLARGRAQLGDYAAAETALIKADESIQPEVERKLYIDVLTTLTDVQILLGKLESAVRNLNRLGGVAPEAPTTLYLAARVAREQKDYALAARHLQTIVSQYPGHVQTELFLASMQTMQGNLAVAQSRLQRVIASAPDNIQARIMLAQIQLEQAKPGDAIELLAPLLRADVVDADMQTLLAQASFQQGDSAETLRRLEAAVLIAPDNMEAKLNLAEILLRSGETKRALEELANVPEGATSSYRRERLLMIALVASKRLSDADQIASKLAATEDSIALTVVAEHYFRTERVDEGKHVLRNLIASSPDSLDSRNILGRVELLQGNIDQARTEFTSVLELDESNLVALLGMAQIQGQSGESDEAIALLEKAAAAHDMAVEPRVLLAKWLFSKGQIEKAEDAANELVVLGVRSPEVSYLLGSIFADVGRSADALAQFEQAARLNSDSAEIQFGLAKANLTLDRSVDARDALIRALEIKPGWPAAMSLLTLVELRQGKIEEAKKLVKEIRALQPGSPAGMALEGEVLFYQNDFVQAAEIFRMAAESGGGRSAVMREFQARVHGSLPDPERALERWLDSNSDDSVARKFLAQYYLANNRVADSVREYESVLKVNPDDTVVLNNLAWMFQQNGEMERAAKMAERAYMLNSSSGSIADTLGWIYYDLGQLDKSLEMLSSASKLSPSNGEIQYHYAVVLVDSGKKGQARSVLKKLLESDANFQSRDKAEELLGQL